LLKSIKNLIGIHKSGNILDYGCATGVFLATLDALKTENVCKLIGYEPYQRGHFRNNITILADFNDVYQYKPFEIITTFEVIEHISFDQLNEFITRCDEILAPDGIILISVPVEIGLSLILKEFHHRSNKERCYLPHLPLAFLKAVFGKAYKRCEPYKDGVTYYDSHRGFDFREMMKHLNKLGWKTQVLSYTPFPFLKSWLFNSEVFIQVTRN
jgi:SAM-dependent methyltransferase